MITPVNEEFIPQTKPRETLNILATIEVSKGEVFHSQLTIVAKDGCYYHIQHKLNHLPSPSRLWDAYGDTTNYTYRMVSREDALMLVNAIGCWESLVSHKDHLNTFIYSYILGKWNVDLIDIGIFDV